MSAKECQTCGREDGHWLGCAGERPRREPLDLSEDLAKLARPLAAEGPPPKAEVACEYGECANDKRPQGQGPKPKYCDDHREQKNRK